MTFEERVQLNEDKLNDTDDQIVEYIRKNREEIGDISIQAMAKALYTVPNTIVRFAKKLGYRGFAEMKAALALENRRAEEDPHLPVTGIIQKNLGTAGFRADSPGGAENAPGQAGVFLRGGRFRPFLRDDGKIFAVCRQTGRFFHPAARDVVSGRPLLRKGPGLCDQRIRRDPAGAGVGGGGQTEGNLRDQPDPFEPQSAGGNGRFPPVLLGAQKVLNRYEITDRTSMYIVLRRVSEVYWKVCGVV
jgi:hypothetical protein